MGSETRSNEQPSWTRLPGYFSCRHAACCIQLYRSVTMSTFRSNNSPSPVCMGSSPPPDGYKCLTSKGSQSARSPDRYKCNHLLQSSFSHPSSWLAIRTMCSPGRRRIPAKASCSAHGASSIDSKYVLPASYDPQWSLPDFSQTETNAQGQSTTTVWRAIRANKEDRVAKLEWAPGGGLGRAVIGKVRHSPQGIPHLTSFLHSSLVIESCAYVRLGPPGPTHACEFQFTLIVPT